MVIELLADLKVFKQISLGPENRSFPNVMSAFRHGRLPQVSVDLGCSRDAPAASTPTPPAPQITYVLANLQVKVGKKSFWINAVNR